MRDHDKKEWTDAEKETLRKLWGEGHSSVEIGERMGRTKNAVIGCAHRLYLPSRPSPIVHTGEPAKRPNAARAPKATLPALASVAMPVRPPGHELTPAGEPRSERVRSGVRGSAIMPPQIVAPIEPVVTLPVQPCCWPMWGKGRPTHSYCEAPSRPGKPYCPKHHKAAYVPLAKASEFLRSADRPGRAA